MKQKQKIPSKPSLKHWNTLAYQETKIFTHLISSIPIFAISIGVLYTYIN